MSLIVPIRRNAIPKLCRVLLSLALLLPVGLVTTPVLAQDATQTDAQDVQVTEKARRLFQAGVDFMQDPDGARYGEAYRSFKAAYEESPSWKILGNLGIAAMKIERDGEAIEALGKYLDAGRSTFEQDEIEQVERDLRTLRASVTWITISVNVPDAIIEDIRTPLTGSPVSNRYDGIQSEGRLGIHNGRHQITVKKDGFEPSTWSFEATGEDLTHTFELLKTPEEPQPVLMPTTTSEPVAEEVHRPVPLVTWITAGCAVAFGAGATATGILALNKNKDFDEQNTGENPDDAENLRNSGQTLNIVTDALIGAAVVSAAVATITYFKRPAVPRREQSSVSLLPAVSKTGGGLFFQGQF